MKRVFLMIMVISVFIFSGIADALMVEKIVWVSSIAGSEDIWIMNPDGSDKIQLTNDAYKEYTPSISPDGKSIVWASKRTGYFELWEMNVDGTNQRQLTNLHKELDYPSWSPDGSKIYFWERSLDKTLNVIKVMDADGNNMQTILTNALTTALNPDGTKIAYANHPFGGPNDYDVWVANIDGTNPQNLSELAGFTGLVQSSNISAWGNNGKILATVGLNYNSIYWINQDASDYGIILEGTNSTNLHAGWSLDETQIVFWSDRSGSLDIWKMDADGTNLLNLTDSQAFDRYPNWGFIDDGTAPVPEPATLLLLGSGLICLFGARRKSKKQSIF